jgi:hypothetical protein
MTTDFDNFIDRMSRLSYEEILREADRAAGATERSVKRIRTVVERRQSGGRKYVERIGAFLYFMRFQSRPSGASDSDFLKYRRVIEALVNRGEMEPEALRVFD